MGMADDLPEAPGADDAPELDDNAQPSHQPNQATSEEAHGAPELDAAEADTKGPGCILPAVQVAVPEAASGWQTAVDGAAEDDSAENEGDVDMHEAENDEETGADQQPEAVAGDTLQFFFLDALYEPAMVGTVLLIGKVLQGNEYVSACVRVKDMRQCVFVTPKRFVFQDTEGDIERCAPTLTLCIMSRRLACAA